MKTTSNEAHGHNIFSILFDLAGKKSVEIYLTSAFLALDAFHSLLDFNLMAANSPKTQVEGYLAFKCREHLVTFKRKCSSALFPVIHSSEKTNHWNKLKNIVRFNGHMMHEMSPWFALKKERNFHESNFLRVIMCRPERSQALKNIEI